MKYKIFISLLLLFTSIVVSAQFPNTQTVSNPNTIYQPNGALKGKLAFMLPIVDTLNNKATPYPGSLTIRPQDTLQNDPPIYRSNGRFWSQISSNSNVINYLSYNIKGDFIYDSLLYFHNTPYQYYILGRYFTAPYTSHLLTPPNPSAARNDVAYVDTLNSAGVITGVNGGGVPATNPVSQFKIGEIHINAADTVPSNFSNVIAYRNNLEWIASSSISGFNNAYATAPFTGTSTSMYVPSFVDGETISILRDTLLNISNASYLKVFVWLNASFSAANLNFSFNNLGNAATTSVPLLNGQFGYVSTLVGSWQEVNIPMAYFQLFSNSIDEIIVGMTGANASGFKIGNVVIQFGGLPTSSAIGGIQAVNDNYGPKVYFSVTDTGYVDSDTSNYVYKDKRTNTVLFTLPTYLKNLVSNRTAADTCIVLDTLGKTIFISLNPYCMGSGGGSGWLLTGNAGTDPTVDFLGTTDNDSMQISLNGNRTGWLDNAKYNYGIGIGSLFSNTTGSWNTGLGNYTLLNNTTGQSNTAIGNTALNKNTTGAGNIAIGNSSLYFNTTGVANTGIGHASLQDNTTATYNTAIGYSSLLSNITGQYNVGLGANAGAFNTTASNQIFINSLSRVNYLGDTTASPIWVQQNATVASQRIKLNGMVITPVDAYVNTVQIGRGSTTRGTDSLNILIGREALLSNTSGYKNIAIGDSSLRLNTTGLGNTAIGVMSMIVSTTGHNNTAIGRDALKSNTTGGSNVGIGGSILTANTTGNTNVGIGTSVLASNVTGSSNTAIGFSSLGDNTASSNTAIGSYAGRWNTSAASQIFINGINRSDYLGDTTGSPIYIKQNSTVASQIIKLNGIVQIPVGAGASKILTSDASGYATWETPSAGGVAWGAITGTLSDQSDLNTALGLKAPLASPTFTGTVTIPTPFTLGATSVTATGTELNYVAGVTSAIQTQFSGKAALATANIFTTNGAVSAPANTFNGTWYSGGSTTTTKPFLLIEPSGATSTNWNANGTGLAVNGASGSTADLFNVQLNAAARFRIASTGAITANSSLTITGDILTAGAIYRSTNNGIFSIYNDGAGGALLQFYGSAHATLPNRMKITSTNGVGIGLDPTAVLHIKASTATASTGQIKLAEGTRQTAAEDGTINYIANNLEFVETSTVYTLAKTLTATATLDFGSTAAGTATDLTITVTGAADGDPVSVGVPNGSTVANGSFTAWVSATNTVTVRFSNSNLVTALDPASGTFRASVIRY